MVALSNSEGQTAGGTRERQQRRALATTPQGAGRVGVTKKAENMSDHWRSNNRGWMDGGPIVPKATNYKLHISSYFHTRHNMQVQPRRSKLVKHPMSTPFFAKMSLDGTFAP